MPRVGEAWYDLSARDAGLVKALGGAESKARASGHTVENAFGKGAQGGIDKTAASATRFGGVMTSIQKPTSKFGGVMQGVGMGVLQGVGIAGFMGATAAAGAFVEGIGRSISAASDLNETISKSKVVFGDRAQDLIDWSQGAATAIGMSQNAALGAAATYGNLFVSMGLAEEKSADMSQSLVTLAGDLASFNNVDPTEALDALRSGLVGETEPLKRFGVNLNEATLSQKALEMGLISTTKGTLPAAIKAQAAYALIIEQTKTAQGDFARTSDGLANQQRIAAARVEDAFAEMGQAILPLAAEIVPMLTGAMVALVRGISDVIKWLQGLVEANQELFDVLGTIVGFVAGTFFQAIGSIASVVKSAFEGVSAALDIVTGVIGGAVDIIIGAVKAVVDVAASIPGPWQDAAKGMQAALDQMQSNTDSKLHETRRDAEGFGKAIPGAIAGPIAAGAGTVGDAAASGIHDPVVAQTKAAAKDAGAAAKETPRQIADSLIDGQFNVKSAAEALKDVQKNALSKTKEIAKIEGFLSGDALAKALKDKRPAVRAEAQAWKAAAEERLFALKNGVPELARKTGQSYADALAAKKTQVKSAAEQHVAAVRAKYQAFEDRSERWGYNTGKTYANGLRNSTGWLKSQVDAYLNAARSRLQALSPPKEGPFKHIDDWGYRLGTTYAESFADAGRVFGLSANSFLQPGRQRLDPTATTSLSPGATAPASAAPSAAPISVSATYAPTIGTATQSEMERAAANLGTAIIGVLAARGVIARPAIG